jgi:hypothetical protein
MKEEVRILAAFVVVLIGFFPEACFSAEAPADEKPPPLQSPLPEAELKARREALRSRIYEPLALEARSYRLLFERATSSFVIEDRRTGEGWHTPLERKGFAKVELAKGGRLPIDMAQDVKAGEKEIRFRGRSSAGEAPAVDFALRVLDPLVGLEVSFEVAEAARADVRAVRLLDGCLWVADADGGGAVLPRGLGEWMPAAGGDIARRFQKDDGPWAPIPASPEPATMAAVGLVRGPAALLLAWEDPKAEVEVIRGPVGASGFPGRSGLRCSLEIRGARGSVRLFPLGKGDEIDIAHSHRQLVRTEKSPPTLRLRTRDRGNLPSIQGAAILRPTIAAPDPQGKPRLIRSLDEVAATAERWRKALDIDQALVILDGWSAQGAGEEVPAGARPAAIAGGGKALADCARRVKALGWLFGLAAWRAEPIEEIGKGGVAPDLILLGEEHLKDVPPTAESVPPSPWLLGTDGAGEGVVPSCAYLEGILSHKVLSPANGLVFPLFAFSYGHCVRMAVRADEAVEPDSAVRLLAHLAFGEVPIYALEPPASESRGGSPGVKAPPHPSGWSNPCLARADGGWAEGKGLSEREIFVKNTYEVLTHVARIRYRAPLLFRRFLTEDHTVEESWFGEDMRIVVNYGDRDYADAEGDFRLPPCGFWVAHPYFHAFHAVRAHGVDYPTPALFTVRSLEGKMYLRADAVRIFHGFGPSRIRLGGRDFDVAREAVVKIW